MVVLANYESRDKTTLQSFITENVLYFPVVYKYNTRWHNSLNYSNLNQHKQQNGWLDSSHPLSKLLTLVRVTVGAGANPSFYFTLIYFIDPMGKMLGTAATFKMLLLWSSVSYPSTFLNVATSNWGWNHWPCSSWTRGEVRYMLGRLAVYNRSDTCKFLDCGRKQEEIYKGTERLKQKSHRLADWNLQTTSHRTTHGWFQLKITVFLISFLSYKIIKNKYPNDGEKKKFKKRKH